MKKNKNQRIDFKLFFDNKYLKNLFEKKLRNRLDSIDKIKIYSIKRYNKADFQHCVNCYVVDGRNKEGRPDRVVVFCSGHSDGSRKKSYQLMEYLYSQFKYEKDFGITEPLFYSNELKASFHLSLPGPNLFSILKETPGQVDDYLKPLAEFVSRLHGLKPPPQVTAKKIDKHLIDPSNILKKLGGKKLPPIRKIEEFMELLKNYQGKKRLNTRSLVLCHGDLNQENIIINKNDERFKKIGIIDYTDLCLAEREFDVGHFTQRLVGLLFFKPDQSLKLAEEKAQEFVSLYYAANKAPLNAKAKESICFYESVSSIKMAVYSLYKKSDAKVVNFYLRYARQRLVKIGLIK